MISLSPIQCDGSYFNINYLGNKQNIMKNALDIISYLLYNPNHFWNFDVYKLNSGCDIRKCRKMLDKTHTYVPDQQ